MNHPSSHEPPKSVPAGLRGGRWVLRCRERADDTTIIWCLDKNHLRHDE